MQGSVPSFPARSNTSKQTSAQNLKTENILRGGGRPCAEADAEAPSRCRLAPRPGSEPFALGLLLHPHPP